MRSTMLPLLVETATFAVRAQNNWWGTADTSLIDGRITDGADSPGVRRVYYKPIISPRSNEAPALAWTGLAGSQDDGVSPDSVDPYQYVDFRVKYIDGDGQPPTYIQLHLLKGSAEFEQSPMRWHRYRASRRTIPPASSITSAHGYPPATTTVTTSQLVTDMNPPVANSLPPTPGQLSALARPGRYSPASLRSRL